MITGLTRCDECKAFSKDDVPGAKCHLYLPRNPFVVGEWQAEMCHGTYRKLTPKEWAGRWGQGTLYVLALLIIALIGIANWSVVISVASKAYEAGRSLFAP
jgi:hypothetical protein